MQTSRATSTHVRHAPVIGRYSAWLPLSGIDQAETFWLSDGCAGKPFQQRCDLRMVAVNPEGIREIAGERDLSP